MGQLKLTLAIMAAALVIDLGCRAQAQSSLDDMVRLAQSHDATQWHQLLARNVPPTGAQHWTINIIENKVFIVAQALAQVRNLVRGICQIASSTNWDRAWAVQGFVEGDPPMRSGDDCEVK